MKQFIFIITLILVASAVRSQTIEILGQAKVTTMNEVATASSNVVKLADGTLAVRKYDVGDFVQGGIVFFVDETGEHGLVCAKEDQSPNIRWFAGSLVTTQAKGDGPFSGEMNTLIAISSHAGLADDGATYAARICAELMVTENGFTYGDWYLPSKHELNLMHLNLTAINATAIANGGDALVAFASYWSSTEVSNSHAWSQNITFGTQASTGKSSAIDVRAIRAF